VRRLIRSKKGEENNTVLEYIVKILPRALVFLILLALVFSIYQRCSPREEYSVLVMNLKALEHEIHQLGGDETINVPAISRGKHKFVLYPKDKADFDACRKKPCLCIYQIDSDGSTGKKECQQFPKFNFKASCVQTEENTITVIKKDGQVKLDGSC